MTDLRHICARLLMACLAVMIIAGSLGMGVSGAQSAPALHEAAVADAPEAAGHPAGCPSEQGDVAGMDLGHDGCAMTLCCFTDLPGYKAERAGTLEPVRFAVHRQTFVLTAQPDMSDKPPILA